MRPAPIRVKVGLISVLSVVCATAQPARPQTPQPPFPYRTEEVKVAVLATGITLACTFAIPDGPGPRPAVLLLTGSGPQDRDETVFAHKPFLVLADHLARRGIASLRCDDRGTGKSTGRFIGATTRDLALDDEAAFRYLSRRPEARIAGILGHSEGANIAALLASRRRDVAFIVMMAGTGVTGEQVGFSQATAIRRASGASDAEIELQLRIMRAMVASARAGASETERLKLARAKFGSNPEAERLARLLSDPWHRAAVDYDPAPILAKAKCPVLVLNGELDRQVVADVNVPAIEAALRRGGNSQVTVRRFPRLNHGFQSATTGLPSEYAQIEETIAPQVLTAIADWISRR